MTIRDDDLRAIWQNAPAVPPDRSGCLTDHEWALLLSQEPDDPERVRMASHIAECTACTEEYRLLLPLKDWNAELERVLSPAQPVVANRRSSWLAWWSPPRLALAAAAAIALLVSNGVMVSQVVKSRRESTQLETQLAQNSSELSAARARLGTVEEQLRSAGSTQEQVITLQQRVAQLSAPQLDAATIDLAPQVSGTVRGASDPQLVVRPADAPSVTLILSFPPLASRSTIEVTLESKTGQVRWMARAQRDEGTAALTVTLPGVYPADEYMLRLVDVTRRQAPLATYSVLIRDTPKNSQ